MKEAVEEKWKDRKENCRKQEKKNKEGIKEVSRRAGTEEGRRENEVGQIRKFGY